MRRTSGEAFLPGLAVWTADNLAIGPWPASERAAAVLEAIRSFRGAIQHPVLGRVAADPSACNFLAGSPQEVASRAYVETLQRWAEPADKDWCGYKAPDERAKQATAAGLSAELGMEFDRADILLTRGAHGGLASALGAVVDSGDEVVFVSPPWFFYEALILGAGGVPVRVRMDEDTFDLDIDAIADAISPRNPLDHRRHAPQPDRSHLPRYSLHVPEATFYLLVRGPVADDLAFAVRLAERGVLVLPGRSLELPGFFRISLTATDAMIERALSVFAKAIPRSPTDIGR